MIHRGGWPGAPIAVMAPQSRGLRALRRQHSYSRWWQVGGFGISEGSTANRAYGYECRVGGLVRGSH